MTTTAKQFKKAFPKQSSKEEEMSFVSAFKKDKRNVDKWSKCKVDYYGNNIK